MSSESSDRAPTCFRALIPQHVRGRLQSYIFHSQSNSGLTPAARRRYCKIYFTDFAVPLQPARPLLTLLLLLIVASSPLLLTAQETAAPPSIFMGREIAATMHYLGAEWLTRESRQREEDCEQLLKALDFQPGQTICDLGCGNGFYTLQIAEKVGKKGKVLAVDIQPEMLHMLELRAKELQIDNIELVLGTEDDPKLAEASVDQILLVDVYHEFSKPAEMLTAMKKSLKPKGEIILVEFRGEDPEVPIKPLHKMTKEQINKEISAHGFELTRQYDQLPWQHVLWFTPSITAAR